MVVSISDSENGEKRKYEGEKFLCNRRGGEGHRDTVNTNTTSGRGGRRRNKNHHFLHIFLLSMHRQKYKIGMSVGVREDQSEYFKTASYIILKDVELLHLQSAKSVE